MLDAGASFTLCTRNGFIITEDNTDNPFTDFNSVVERGFPVSLMPASVIFTVGASLAL